MSFTIEQKVEIIKHVDSGGSQVRSQVNVANLHGISASTVGTICKNRGKTMENFFDMCTQYAVITNWTMKDSGTSDMP